MCLIVTIALMQPHVKNVSVHCLIACPASRDDVERCRIDDLAPALSHQGFDELALSVRARLDSLRDRLPAVSFAVARNELRLAEEDRQGNDFSGAHQRLVALSEDLILASHRMTPEVES